MTKEECVAKFKHQLWGIMLDVSRFSGPGSARAILEEQVMAKISACIGAIWQDCQPKVVEAVKAPAKPNGPGK